MDSGGFVIEALDAPQRFDADDQQEHDQDAEGYREDVDGTHRKGLPSLQDSTEDQAG